MLGRLRTSLWLPVLVLSFLAVSPAPSSAAVPAASVDWATYGFDLQRSGYNSAETILGTGNVGGLHQIWSRTLGDDSYNAPTLAAGVLVGGNPTDVLYAGTEDGMFTAIDAASGAVLWQRNVGVGPGSGFCPPQGASAGSTIDRAAGLVYMVGGNDRLYALDLATGTDAPGWPVQVTTNVDHEHAYSAITKSGRAIYVSLSGYTGDCAPYKGAIVGVDAQTARVVRRWNVTGNGSISGGGIWAWGGVSIDPRNTDVYTATGNALGANEHALYAEHVVRLSMVLTVKASHFPGATGFDVDFGSTPVLYQAPGCPVQLAVENKDGNLYVYNADSISGGPAQQIKISGGGFSPLIGQAAYSPAATMLYVGNASNQGIYQHGLLAFSIGGNCQLSLAWQRTIGNNGDVIPPPVVANGVVYLADGSNPKVYAFDALTGAPLWNSGTAVAQGFSSAPIVVNGMLFVAGNDNKIHAFGL